MRTPLYGVLASILSLLILVTAAFSQGDRKQKKTFVDVRVSLGIFDSKNEPVNGISAADIKLFEDGVEQTVTSVTNLGDGLDLSIVVDCTGSVRAQLDDLIAIAKRLVGSIRSNDQATIIKFVSRDKITVEQAWTNDKSKLNRALDNLFVEGGASAVLDALYLATDDLAARRKKEAGRRPAIVLISDGEDRDSYYRKSDVIRLIRKNDVRVFVIALTKDLPNNLPGSFPANYPPSEQGRKTVTMVVNLANDIAAVSGGTAYILQDESTREDLEHTIASLTGELRAQYSISYTSTGVNKPMVRKLTVTITDGSKGEKRTAVIKDAVALLPK